MSKGWILLLAGAGIGLYLITRKPVSGTGVVVKNLRPYGSSYNGVPLMTGEIDLTPEQLLTLGGISGATVGSQFVLSLVTKAAADKFGVPQGVYNITVV